MIRAASTLIALLLAAEFGSEAVDVKDRGAVDLASFECRDTPRSTIIQRACYDHAQAAMIVSVKGAYFQYCDLPAATFDGLMAAPSMGQFFRQHVAGAGSNAGTTAEPGGCRDIRLAGKADLLVLEAGGRVGMTSGRSGKPPLSLNVLVADGGHVCNGCNFSH